MPKKYNYTLQDYKKKLQLLWMDKLSFQFNNDYHYSETIVDCVCKNNHYWKSKIYTLLKGHGCLQCAGKKRLTQEQAQRRLLLRAKQFSFYPFVYENIRTKIRCICKKCNGQWVADFTHLTSKNEKTGCPICRRSRGQSELQRFLIQNNITYESQKTFEKCTGSRKKLLFDFYLPKYNICIQVQGSQHFKAVDKFGGDKGFQITKKYDQIKRQYCAKNKIQLIYINNKSFVKDSEFCLSQIQFQKYIYKIVKEYQFMEKQMQSKIKPPQNHIRVLDNGFGWVGLLSAMGNETTIVNSARISFQNIKEQFDERDEKLLKYLIQNKHTTPLEHVTFTFMVHCPLYVRSQWHRHRTWSYNEVSGRYTSENITFYVPQNLRKQSQSNRQASTDEIIQQNEDAVKKTNQICFQAYHWYLKLLQMGVCRQQARGVLPQCMMTTFWATVDLHNLLHFIELRDDEHAQKEIREYAKAMKELIRPYVPHVVEYFEQMQKQG